jgi:hypothetical protein
MIDRSTDDPLRAAFAELRSTELGRVVPPGVAAARRTVRRRKLSAAGAAAGVTAVVVLGIGALPAEVAGWIGPEREPTTEPAVTPSDPADTTGGEPTGRGSATPTAEPPDPGAAGDRGGANEAEEQALDAVDFDTHEGEPVPGFNLNRSQRPPGSRYHTFFVEADEPDWTRTLHDTHHPRVATGRYLVRVWCGDDGGSAVVTLRAGAVEATTVADCAMTEDGVRAGVGEVVLAADQHHEITLAVELDPAAWTDGARPVLAVVAIPQGVELPRRPGPDQP